MLEGTSPPQMRLFAPAEHPSLMDVYKLHWERKRKKKTTACADREAIRAFERVVGDIPAKDLTPEVCKAFRREMKAAVAQGRWEPDTVNKRITALNHLLRLLAPDDGSADDEDDELQPIGLLPRQLKIKCLPRQRKLVVDVIHMSEQEQFLARSDGFRWVHPKKGKPIGKPPEMPAPAWWRAVWCLAYNTAMRTEELLLVEWQHLQEDADGVWFNLPHTVTKTEAPRWCYLNIHARKALQALRACGSPTVLGWHNCKEELQRLRRAAFIQAGLTRLVKEEIGFHGLRKACATALTRSGGEAVSKAHLGHAAEGTTARHYLDRTIVIDHVDRLPQPRIIDPTDPQKRLFD
jgi:integrase